MHVHANPNTVVTGIILLGSTIPRENCPATPDGCATERRREPTTCAVVGRGKSGQQHVRVTTKKSTRAFEGAHNTHRWLETFIPRWTSERDGRLHPQRPRGGAYSRAAASIPTPRPARTPRRSSRSRQNECTIHPPKNRSAFPPPNTRPRSMPRQPFRRCPRTPPRCSNSPPAFPRWVSPRRRRRCRLRSTS